MKFNMNIRSMVLASAFVATAAFAEGQDSLVQQQSSLLQKLDSLNSAVLGLRINGTVKAGGLSSKASSDQFASESPVQENQAYTDANLRLTARPSAETQIDVQLRLHKDWQSGYDENNNPVIGHWFSYDGSILNNHVDFNMGYMRVGYTPFTIFTPQAELLQEPEIFAAKRAEALARRNLDTTSRRLMQGLNAEYHSGSFSVIDNITAQLTGARMRNTSKKLDQVFFDFDYSDRYLYAGRLGVDAFGAHIGVNYVDVFDRVWSRRSHTISAQDTIYYDDNSVLSGELGFDSKKLLPTLPVSFGATGEFAMSKWDLDRDYMSSTLEHYRGASQGYVFDEDGNIDSIVYISDNVKKVEVLKSESYADDDGKAFYVEPFINGNIAGLEFSLKGQYLQVDKDFWSEMASTPTFQGGAVVLNANALYTSASDSMMMTEYGSSSLENLYFEVYNATVLQANNMMTSGVKNVLSPTRGESGYLYSRLYNNYKSGHFYRNGYSATVLKRSEMNETMLAMNPTVDLAMPFGLATPDRKGFRVSFDAKWNDAIALNGRLVMVTQEDAVSGVETDAKTGDVKVITDENNFAEYAGGLGVDFGRLFGLDREITLQGSYSYSEEDSYLKRNADRIIAGATVDVWGPIALLAGYQEYNRHFGSGLWMSESAAIVKAKESLLMGGLRVKIAPMSYISLQYGMLSSELAYKWQGESGISKNELSIDKNVVAADVTVNF